MTTSKWTAENLPDMAGRTVIVTGASGGLGEVTAHQFARAGAFVVLAVRDVDKGALAAARMPGETEVRPLDLSIQSSVRAFARDWTGGIDVLVNNAGIMMVPKMTTVDGFELQMATNHLGHFLLTNLLSSYITDRVVTVSSQLHRTSRLPLDDLAWTRRNYDEMGAYADSKLANVLFGIELNRRLHLSGSTVRSIVAHPGIARTTLASHARGFAGSINKLGRLLNSVDAGALPTLYAATQDVVGGSYVGPDSLLGIKGSPALGKPSRRARNTTLAADLWSLSADLTGIETTLTS